MSHRSEYCSTSSSVVAFSNSLYLGVDGLAKGEKTLVTILKQVAEVRSLSMYEANRR